ncbi:hypothetical protein [Thermococcus sp. M36]|uniref:hypothetical protein n=1 Tax=Thermococcus sp. M36 TaxID=1638261 RepID=UPI001F104EC9|nr:hypothetical protein [Thermococcus sp. M36]
MLMVSLIALWASHWILNLDAPPALLVGIGLVATFFESLPLPSAYDEFTVPFSTALLLWLAYGGALLSPTW